MYGNSPLKSRVSNSNWKYSTVNQALPNHQSTDRRNVREVGINEGSFSDIFGNVRRQEVQVAINSNCIHTYQNVIIGRNNY